MAKKKKQTKRKKAAPVEEYQERSAFWAVFGSILLIVIAFFMLLGGFGTGGALPLNMFQGMYNFLGAAAYITPFAIFSFAWWKLRSEFKYVPLARTLLLISWLALSATWLHVTFATKALDGSFTGDSGGMIGRVLGGVLLSAVDKIPASILVLVFVVLSFMLAYGISFHVFASIFSMFSRPQEDDTDLAELKSRAAESTGFKLNEGVPVEHHSARDKARMSTFKNTAEKLNSSQDHAALTAVSDPDWQFPSISLLNQKVDKANAGDVEGNAEIIKDTFSHFDISVEMEGATVGPTVTQYTLKPPTNVKLTKITALENNLALSLAAQSLRMEAPIPGKRAVGIEVPNIKPAVVRVSSLLQSQEWINHRQPLAFAIGKDINGKAIIGDLAEMPHLLIAGQTKSGKSVMINTLLTSLIYRNSPSEMKLILVDPKVVELAPYNNIPHLLAPVISEPEKCISALKWAVAEMERRYRALAEEGVRNIEEYNGSKKEEGMPYIVIVIDELADLMMMAARDVEALIVRIAQKARAVGLHLVLATQSPRVDVITGLIKANVPSKIAFAVANQVESRIVIDGNGAEKLLGKGDMLFKTTDMPRATRVQGAFISTEETKKVTAFLREQREPQYDDEIITQPVQLNGKGGVVADYGGQDADDDMYKEAVRAVIEGKKASTSLLQRRLRIGYGRAARLIETMEEQGIISSADGNRPREVLVSSLDEVFGGGSADDAMYDENFPDDSNA